MKTKFDTREEWLDAATELLRPLFRQKGHEIPPVKSSVGWPSRKATSSKSQSIGQCWDKAASEDKKTANIFISPVLAEPVGKDGMGVLPTHAHELVHAVVGCKEKHNKVFGKLARAIGLEGKLTFTHAGEELCELLEGINKELGPYPHHRINPALSGIKKQGTRLIKCECPDCGYVIRTTQKWIEIGTPSCPCGEKMIVAEPKE